jgi:drug/metabolite transporter (DMT)-like permease
MLRLTPTSEGLLLGLVGVTAFSLTLPMTRLAVGELSPLFIACGRALIAASLAGLVLMLTRQRFPGWALAPRLLAVAFSVVVGFPVLLTWALQYVPAVHAAVVTGVLPLSTALFGALLAGERPSAGFWAVTVAGSAIVICYALVASGGAIHIADLALLAAAICSSYGYAEGARLSRVIGGWQVISWALVLIAPFMAVPVAIILLAGGVSAGPAAWAAFAYVGTVSMYLGFLPWYRGLMLGGIARVGQLQLLQPFLTMFFAGLWFGESVGGLAVAATIAVVVCIALGRRMTITTSGDAPAGSKP